MSENKETLDLSSSPSENNSKVKGPSVKIQHMDGILKNIIEKKKNVSEEEQDEDYEKLVDQIEDELSEDELSEDESEDELSEDVRWASLQKLIESHQLLCESFNKLLHEEDEE